MNRFLSYIVFSLVMLSCTDEEVSAQISEEVSVSCTLPVMYIETENHKPITSKTDYLQGSYWIDAMNSNDFESVGTAELPLPMQIRGRGHSSWKGPKKPYKIKLEAKTSLLGMAKNKHWALLKPSENTVAGLRLGKIMDMAWTPDFRPIEVVLNGDYIGLYFLTETIRIDKNRVNIFEQEDRETDTELVKGGWLVEVDNYRDDCQITIPENKRWNLTIRYHSPEELSSVQLKWLNDEFKAINAAIYSVDKTSTEWENYIDVESMARFFIIQEVMDNPDGFHGSFYLHKDLGEDCRWVAGPIWDLVCYNREKTDYTFRMSVHYTFTPHWIGEIIQYDSFCKAVAKAWGEVYGDKIYSVYDFIDQTMSTLETAWANDCKRWNDDPLQTASVRCDKIKNALARNIEWFNNHLPKSAYSSLPAEVNGLSDSPVKVYNLQGIAIGEYINKRAALSSLQRGVYIINAKKIFIR